MVITTLSCNTKKAQTALNAYDYWGVTILFLWTVTFTVLDMPWVVALVILND